MNMRQAFHIFKKDVRYLRNEICLLLALDVIFTWLETKAGNAWWVEGLLPIAAVYLIVRLMHAEAIPGDNQFWITRPYEWKSLAGAKALFILVFVELPLFVAQLLILIANGFPLADTVPGLLWTQVLLVFGVWFPIAAIAALTSGIAAFLFSLLILLAIVFSAQQTIFWLPHLRPTVRWPEAVEWVRDSILMIAIVAIALWILYVQYKSRRTALSRTFAIGAAALTGLVYWYVPLSFAMPVESWLSKRPSVGSSIEIVLGPQPKQFGQGRRTVEVQVDVPIVVRGIPAATEVRADAFDVTFQRSDGRTWKSGLTGMYSRPNSSGLTILDGIVVMDRTIFDAEKALPVTLHASLYLTLFGNSRSRTIPLKRTPVNAMDGLQCYLGDMFDHFYCRSAFRWPDRLVSVEAGVLPNPLYTFVSYSPFPAGINLNDNIEAHWADGPPASAGHATVIVKEPLAHFRRDLEVRSITLTDLAAQ
jgi:hypothetical protein